MIAKMKKYSFLVFHKQYDLFLARLRDLGVLHVEKKAEGAPEDEQLTKEINLLSQVEKTVPEVESYLLKDSIASKAEAFPDAIVFAEKLLSDFRQLQAEHQRVINSMNDLTKQISAMQVWGNYSTDKINALQDAGYRMRFFTCSPKSFDEDEFAQLYNAVVVAQTKELVYFVTVERRSVSVDVPADEVKLQEHNAEQLRTDLEALRHLLVAAEGNLQGWAIANINNLKAVCKELRSAIDWKTVHLNTTALAEDKLCLLEGYCPVENVPQLEEMLQDEHILFEAVDPTEADPTPVKLRNNWFTKLFEVFTGMYGWPVYGEFDPTPILAPFYLLFFSMCMGDAGYGILLILFGLLVHYKKVNIAMFEGLGPIITTLGVGTLVVGFFLGTAFGVDLSMVFPQIDYLFLNGKVLIEGGIRYVSKAVYASEGLSGGYDAAMVLSILIGVFHICLAMVVKALCYTKRFGFRNQLATWGWTLLIVGGLSAFIVCMALSVPMNITKIVLISIAIVSALGIYIFNTPGRNPLINIGAGLWDTYNMATGILGDTLSYIRLYALGLAGGMLGGAFNNLGLMVMGGSTEGATWQWLPFIVILLIGHLLNLAMSALGAFVHPLRLSFVEYFKNSGYEGKGQLYEPFAVKS